MAAGKINSNCNEHFFQAVSKGSIPELQDLLKKIKPHEEALIANSFNSGGETPLLVAIKGNHREMVKFLIEEIKADVFKTETFTWKDIEHVQALPLFAAILSHFTTDQGIVKFLVLKTSKQIDSTASHSDLLSFLKSNTVTRLQKIVLLEIVGAVYLLQLDDERESRIWLGFSCWILASTLRLPENPSDPPILKTQVTLSAAARKVFGTTTEFQTLDELQEIFNSPDHIILLQAQALLVIHRILSRFDPDPHPFYLRRLLHFSVNWHQNANKYSLRVDVVIHILELFHSRQWKDVFDSDWCSMFLCNAVVSMSYSKWKKNEPPPDASQLPFDGFVDVINFLTDLVSQLQKDPDPVQNRKGNKFVRIILDSVEMFTEHGKETSPRFKKWLSDYIKFINSHSGYTVLQAACWVPHLPIKTVQLFLRGKADPNAKDKRGNNALHYVALSSNFPNVSAATKLLLAAGVHLDQGNNFGVTPLDLFKARKIYLDQNGSPDSYLDALVRSVLPLTCLSARVIRQNKISFQDEDLPAHLIPFIKIHSTKRGINAAELSKCVN